MYAISGITGKVGSTLAQSLLAAGERVRAVVRDAEKGRKWAALGCEIAAASMDDAAALTAAFRGATAAFILPPPVFDPFPGYPETRRVVAALETALRQSKPGRVLCISTVGAQATQDNLLSQLSLFEQLPLPIRYLRPAWYLENASWDVTSARDTGVIHSFLTPLDRPFPMVSTVDVGRVAARLIQEDVATGIVELEGPERVSPNDLAAAFSRVLGKPVRAEVVPRNTWEALFRAAGMKNPQPRMRMLDGFNEGWVEFAGPAGQRIRGRVGAEEVVAGLLAG